VNKTAYILYLLLEIGEPKNLEIITNEIKWLFKQAAK
jgi:hypothetical protein